MHGNSNIKLPLLLLFFPDDKMWPYSYHIPADITSARLLVSEGQILVSYMKQPLTLRRRGVCFIKVNWPRGGPNVFILFFYLHVTVHRNKFLFNKTNRSTNFSKFIFVKKLYMFRAVLLPIIRSSSLCIRHWYMSWNFDDSFLQARSAWNSWTCLKAVIKIAWHIPVPNVQWRTLDDGQRNYPKPEYVEFLDTNKFGKISASVGFIKKKPVLILRTYRKGAMILEC